MNEKFCISIQISLKFVPKDPIDNNPALAPNRRQAIIWTIADRIHWRIYAALGGGGGGGGGGRWVNANLCN